MQTCVSFARAPALAVRARLPDGVRPRRQISGAVVRVPRVRVHRSATVPRGTRLRPSAAGDDSESKSSSADTLNALDALLGTDPADDEDDDEDDEDDEAPIISVPLLWMQMPGQTQAQQQPGGSSVASALTGDATPGPGNVYAAITLGLPDRATKKQTERGVKGIELDFCIDTACTTNFILPQVAYGLDMQIVGTAPAGTGATGAIGGGQEMLLGTAKLGGKAAKEDVAAVTGLSAAVVPVPAPGTAGILGRSFLNCFDAVAFDWAPRTGTTSDGRMGDRSGAVIDFYQEYDWDAGAEDGLVTAPLNELACGLLAVDVTLNGVTLPALLDTGAPQTIVNRAAAKAAGIEVGSKSQAESDDSSKSKNPFGGLMDAFGKGKEAAMADKGVMVMGAGGKPTRLDRVDGAGVDLRVVCEGDALVSTLVGSILVGELAAFQAGLGLKPASSDGGDDGEPGVILGLDALMSREEVVISTRPAPYGRPRMQL